MAKPSLIDLLRKSSWLLDETLKNMDVLGEFSLFRSKSNIFFLRDSLNHSE